MPTYIKLDDTCPDHPAIVGLSDAAFACWVRCLCYSSRHLTDGRVPRTALRSLGTPKAVKELIAAGRFHEEGGGAVVIHGYTERQRTREQVERLREQWRERQALQRGHSRESRKDTSESHGEVTRPECREQSAEVKVQSAASAPAVRRGERLLQQAAGVIADRASRRPGVISPAGMRIAVAKDVMLTRSADAHGWLTDHPDATVDELIEFLEPSPTSGEPGWSLPPSSAPEEIADFEPAPVERIPDATRDEGRAAVRALREQWSSGGDAA